MDTDLDYFFNKCSFGIQSNCIASIMSKSQYVPLYQFQGIATFDDTQRFNDGLYRQIKKYNRIARKFYKLSKQQQRYCSALFDHQYKGKFPPEIYILFHKQSAPLALFTTKVSGLQELIRVHTHKNKVLQADIQMEITSNYRQLEQKWKELNDKERSR